MNLGSKKDLRVAVLGATGLVGSEMLKVLEERRFPVSELIPLATSRSAGKKVMFSGREYTVSEVSDNAFDNVDLALFSAGSAASKQWAPIASAKGVYVVDNSSAWRMDPAIPLVTPEVNENALDNGGRIIANPNCATIQAVVALNPLHQIACLEEFCVTTMQSVSGTGWKAVEELEAQAKAFQSGSEARRTIYPHTIFANLIPEIGSFDEDGISQEEWKMLNESRKIMGIPALSVSCTTVRVPVFRGHSETIYARFKREITPLEARDILSRAPGVILVDNPSEHSYPLPVDAANRDEVFVGRIRKDLSGDPKRIAFWVVADNLRKGAATNAVQIAESLSKKGLLR